MLRIVGESDYGLHDLWLPWIYCNPMSTAIVKIYTPEGFVVAADGKTDDRRTDAQKVFDGRSKAGPIAYCLSRCASLSDPDTGLNIQFDGLLKLVADNLRARDVSDLQRYAEVFSRAFGEQVREQVRKAKEQGAVAPGGKRILKHGWETHLHFAGYFKGSASIGMSAVRIHVGKVSVTHPFFSLGLRSFTGHFYGSELVLEALKHGDPCFAQYSSPVFGNPKTVSLSDAINAATKYIEACDSPAGRALDSKCNSIGGRIHIATITPSSGFMWDTPPACASNA